MSIPVRIALILLFVILIGWPLALFMTFYSLAIPMAILTPVFGILGIIFSVRTINKGEEKLWGWILFSAHTIVFLLYACAFVYMAFFWNPRFF